MKFFSIFLVSVFFMGSLLVMAQQSEPKIKVISSSKRVEFISETTDTDGTKLLNYRVTTIKKLTNGVVIYDEVGPSFNISIKASTPTVIKTAIANAQKQLPRPTPTPFEIEDK